MTPYGKSVNVDSYNITWATVGYAIGLLYGAFTGMWLSGRIGARYTIAAGQSSRLRGKPALLTGSAVGLVSLALGRMLDGFGKMMVLSLCRTTLYKQFDRLLLVGIGWPTYGIFAYATRNMTPLIMAELDVELSWRWMYWAQVPIAANRHGACLGELLSSRPPGSAGPLTDRLVGIDGFCGLDRVDRLRLQLVSQVGRLVVEVVCGGGHTVRYAARSTGPLARLRLQS